MANKLIEKLQQQEKDLQFDSFTNEDALKLGNILIKKGEQTDPITIDITKNRQVIFHYSFQGTAVDNDKWVERKCNTVYRFFHSSFLMGNLLKEKGKTLEEVYYIPESEFCAHGGCFPIIVKGVGMVGTATVSGLAQEEDHNLVVEAIKEFLAFM